MDEVTLKKLLDDVKNGAVPIDAALKQLRALPFTEMGFAKVDGHREMRCGMPEAIFCEGKTCDQVREIATKLLENDGNLLATRASAEAYAAVKRDHPEAVYDEAARTITIKRIARTSPPGKILVVSAGTADIPVAQEARVTAEFLDNTVDALFDVGVAGLHRLLAHSKELQDANVVIVVAGMEGALASVVGGMVARPVIAVPTSIGYGAGFGGIAPLLTMLNSCAPGVAVVNIDNGFGAACVASLINHTGHTPQVKS